MDSPKNIDKTVGDKVAVPVADEAAPEAQSDNQEQPKYTDPLVEIRLFNIESSIRLPSITQEVYTTVDKLFLAFGKQAMDGFITIVSVNASVRSFTIVVVLKVSREEYLNAWRNMYSPKSQWLYTEDEWEKWFEFSDPGYVELKSRFLAKQALEADKTAE